MIGKLLSKYLIVLWLVFGSILCNDEYDDRIIYPGPFKRGNHHSQSTGMSLEMEIRLAQEYNQIENIEDFISRIDGIPPDLNITDISIGSRIGGMERSNGKLPTPASCVPKLQPVSLRNSTASSALTYIPNCTRVNRCGGCCTHVTLTCEPTAKVTKNFQVLVVEFDVNTRMNFRSREIVLIDEHTACACRCKTKAHHCNEKQNYLNKECRCACTNVDEAAKCRRNNETRRWDEDSCTCQCTGPTECTTGSYYDHNDCSCKKLGLGGIHRHVIPSERRTYSSRNDIGIRGSGPVPPIFTVSADDPRRRQKDDPEV